METEVEWFHKIPAEFQRYVDEERLDTKPSNLSHLLPIRVADSLRQDLEAKFLLYGIVGMHTVYMDAEAIHDRFNELKDKANAGG